MPIEPDVVKRHDYFLLLIRNWIQLDEMTEEDFESEAADALRDQCDVPWYAISYEEQDLLRKLFATSARVRVPDPTEDQLQEVIRGRLTGLVGKKVDPQTLQDAVTKQLRTLFRPPRISVEVTPRGDDAVNAVIRIEP